MCCTADLPKFIDPKANHRELVDALIQVNRQSQPPARESLDERQSVNALIPDSDSGVSDHAQFARAAPHDGTGS
jgi:hypothetical protein